MSNNNCVCGRLSQCLIHGRRGEEDEHESYAESSIGGYDDVEPSEY